MYDDHCRRGRHRMGRKSGGQTRVRERLSYGGKHVEDGLKKPLSLKKISEVNNLVNTLLTGK
jgi:hypothetical protein